MEFDPQKTKHIKFIVFDIDGVLTDGGMYFSEHGDEYKKFNTKDGMAIKHFIKQGGMVGFLSHGINKTIISNRAKLLGVQKVYAGTESKIRVLTDWATKSGISFRQIAYVGDDINDLEVIEKVGFSACPNDAVESIKKVVNVILDRKGGHACAREFIGKYILPEISY